MLIMESSRLYGCERNVKYCMLFMNFIFLLSGIALISVGSTAHGYYFNFEPFLTVKYFSVPNLMIATGSIIFIVSFFGCCGAFQENYCMLVTFTALMVLVFILEFSAGVTGYAMRDSAAETIKSKMNESMDTYITKKDHTNIWDSVQRTFNCCGTVNPSEWPNKLAKQSNNNKTIIDDKWLPVSCCSPPPGAIGVFNCTMNVAHRDKGCLTKFTESIESHAAQIGGVGLGICFMQAIGIGFAVYLIKAIK